LFSVLPKYWFVCRKKDEEFGSTKGSPQRSMEPFSKVLFRPKLLAPDSDLLLNLSRNSCELVRYSYDSIQAFFASFCHKNSIGNRPSNFEKRKKKVIHFLWVLITIGSCRPTRVLCLVTLMS
jgi:hypothetical protein